MTETQAMTKAELLKKMDDAWNDFNAYLKTLSETDLTVPVDAVGWTVKDHLVHIAVWEDNLYALLTGQNRREYMGIDSETWKGGDDPINAVTQKRYKDKSAAEVLQMLRDAHQHVVEKIKTLTDEEVGKPYNYFQPMSKSDNPVVGSIEGGSFGHYAEHKAWIAAIVASGRK